MSGQKLARPVPRGAVMAIDAYVPGKSAAAGLAEVHKLSSNETPIGPSPHAIEAFRSLADHLYLYPDGSASRVREAIGRRYGLDANQIVCGNGSDHLLTPIPHAHLPPGDQGLYTPYCFPACPTPSP